MVPLQIALLVLAVGSATGAAVVAAHVFHRLSDPSDSRIPGCASVTDTKTAVADIPFANTFVMCSKDGSKVQKKFRTTCDASIHLKGLFVKKSSAEDGSSASREGSTISEPLVPGQTFGVDPGNFKATRSRDGQDVSIEMDCGSTWMGGVFVSQSRGQSQ